MAIKSLDAHVQELIGLSLKMPIGDGVTVELSPYLWVTVYNIGNGMVFVEIETDDEMLSKYAVNVETGERTPDLSVKEINKL